MARYIGRGREWWRRPGVAMRAIKNNKQHFGNRCGIMPAMACVVLSYLVISALCLRVNGSIARALLGGLPRHARHREIILEWQAFFIDQPSISAAFAGCACYVALARNVSA